MKIPELIEKFNRKIEKFNSVLTLQMLDLEPAAEVDEVLLREAEAREDLRELPLEEVLVSVALLFQRVGDFEEYVFIFCSGSSIPIAVFSVACT